MRKVFDAIVGTIFVGTIFTTVLGLCLYRIFSYYVPKVIESNNIEATVSLILLIILALTVFSSIIIIIWTSKTNTKRFNHLVERIVEEEQSYLAIEHSKILKRMREVVKEYGDPKHIDYLSMSTMISIFNEAALKVAQRNDKCLK